jgi:DNA-binding transcriptional regulator YiaG
MDKRGKGRPRVKKGRRGVFAENLRAARKALGLSQVTAAEALRVSLPTIARWEAGYMRPRGPALAFVEAWIAESLGKDGDHGR